MLTRGVKYSLRIGLKPSELLVMSLLNNLISEDITDPIPSNSIKDRMESKVVNQRMGGKKVSEKNKVIAACSGAIVTSLTSKFHIQLLFIFFFSFLNNWHPDQIDGFKSFWCITQLELNAKS